MLGPVEDRDGRLPAGRIDVAKLGQRLVRLAFDLLAEIGGRRSEILGIAWKDVNFEKQTIKVMAHGSNRDIPAGSRWGEQDRRPTKQHRLRYRLRYT